MMMTALHRGTLPTRLHGSAQGQYVPKIARFRQCTFDAPRQSALNATYVVDPTATQDYGVEIDDNIPEISYRHSAHKCKITRHLPALSAHL